ncbi:unnamed protein product [Haemonchus placei]|uniref:Uncharacterized protein n=1 Tax=Haemonchus placei TaxID=6290 RepID=A0A0N4W7T5_HAEPC|nr:unnamed protein product [Haemonchus placei]
MVGTFLEASHQGPGHSLGFCQAYLMLNVRLKERDIICKRGATQQIASILDSLGLFVLLLVQAKSFQQKL